LQITQANGNTRTTNDHTLSQNSLIPLQISLKTLKPTPNITQTKIDINQTKIDINQPHNINHNINIACLTPNKPILTTDLFIVKPLFYEVIQTLSTPKKEFTYLELQNY